MARMFNSSIELPRVSSSPVAAPEAVEADMGCARLSTMEYARVRGLALPARLTSLLDQGRWRHPGDPRWRG